MPRKLQKKLRTRALIAFLVTCIVGFGLGGIGLVRAGIINADEYRQKAESEQLSDTVISAHRGTIYDTNMTVLAQSADSYKVYVDPGAIPDTETAQSIAKNLAELLDLEYETVLEKCTREDTRYVVIATDVEYDLAESIREMRSENGFTSYIGFEDDVTRYYPYDNFCSTLIGFTNSNGKGSSGLEYYYNTLLTGVTGRSITAQNAKAQQIAADYEVTYAAQEGTSLQLTIDSTIQYYLESALSDAVENLDATYGYGIVMDTDTGAVLAMASMPDYNLNDPYTIADEETATELSEIEDETEQDEATEEAIYAQWRNRCITDTYEPGSIFKCITAAAGIEEGVVTPDEMFTCTGSYVVSDRTYHCSNNDGHGEEDFTTSMMNSCNPIFIEVAQRLGVDTFYKYYEAFGMTESTGIDLPAEATPTAGVTYYTEENMGAVQLASTSFGQTFSVTPIQMITAINAIANDGKLMQPYVVEATLDEDGNTISQTEPAEKRQVVSELTADVVTDMMVSVVTDGTARNAYVAGYNVAGKTGTSEKLTSEDGYYIGSFCGFAPADDPEITVLIIIDEPKGDQYTGGKTAAPVAAEVIENTLKYLNVEPEYTDEEEAEQDVSTPNTVGMGISSATASLEEQGFTVEVIGSGAKVTEQYPAAGKLIPQNGIVVLYTDDNPTAEKVTVPNLTGLTLSQAKYAAKNAGLNIEITGNSNGESSLSYKQSLEEGTEVTMGSTVTVSYMETVNKEADIEDTGNAD